jgi:hypothetical protein
LRCSGKCFSFEAIDCIGCMFKSQQKPLLLIYVSFAIALYFLGGFCRYFEPPTSKFAFTRLARMVCSEDTRVYTGSDITSLRPMWGCSCYRHLFAVRVTNGWEKETIPSLWWKCRMELSLAGLLAFESLAPCGTPCFPFYKPRGRRGLHEREREISEEEEGLRGRIVLHLPYMGPTDPVYDDGDGSTSRPLFAIVAIRGHRQPVVALHSALADSMVNGRP